MKHLGDITKIKGNEVPIVDIITGGSPCQDLSCAGLRKGMQHSALGDEETTRSGLFMEQIRITKEMRDECVRQLQMREADVDIRHIRPRYLVWENVPGAFSSNKGEDFRCVLEEVARITDKDAVIPRPPQGKWTPSGAIMLESGRSIAWRVHDAQFWGVPQRRKRISLVADFGGTSAPEILFERKGLSGDSEQSGEERQETSGTVERDSDPSSFTLKIRGGVEIDSKGKRAGKGAPIQTELSGTLGVSQDQTLITGCNNQTEVYGICSDNSNSMKSSNPYSGIYKAETTRTLDLNGGNPACNQGGMLVLEGNGQRDSHKGDGYKESETMYTLNTVEQHAVLYSVGHDIRSAKFTDDEITDPLTATDYKDPIKINDCRKTFQDITGTLYCGIAKGTGNQLANQDMFIANSLVVRRLTPMECERLQGFPNGWTDIGEWVDSKGKKHKDADSPRYKALGNSIALPYWSWMAERMVKQLKADGVENPTMASLFDGIGGFPLVYSRCGCKPVWASEIEEFPIAVTKIRFPEGESE